MSKTVVQSQVAALEQEFIAKVNAAIANKVTPVYNVFLFVCASFFGYLVFT